MFEKKYESALLAMDSLVYDPNVPTMVWMSTFFFLCFCFAILAVLGKSKMVVVKGLMRALLLAYSFVVLCSTVFYREELPERKYELTPFWSYAALANNDQSVTYWSIILNVLLFVPVGLLLGGLVYEGVKKLGSTKKRWWRLGIVAFVGFFLSSIIEILQYLLKRGFCETDDLIHNTLGCMLGYGVFLMIVKSSEYKQLFR